MKHHQQRQADALRRVQDFLEANADAVKPLGDSEGRKQLSAAITRVGVLANDQGSADLQMAGQISREKSLATDLVTRHMQPIATFARARLRGVPDFAALTRPVAHLHGNVLVHAARAMATAAAPHADALVRGGFPADTITQLAAAADALNAVLGERANTKVGRVFATRGIEEQLRSGREAVSMLHAVLGRQYAGDHTFLAAWRAASRVVSKPGAVRVRADSAAVKIPDGVTTPASTSGAAIPVATQLA